MTTQRFFTTHVRDGTRVKLAFVSQFIIPWSARLTSYAGQSGHPTIWFVDLFAGEGILAFGEKGSPLIAASQSLSLASSASRNSRIRLGVIAVEEKQSRFRRLETHAQPFRDKGVPFHTYQGDWIDHVRAILRLTGSAPVLLFVDPFGLKPVPFRRLLPLLARNGPTDVIVRLHDPAVFRNAGNYPELITEALGTSKWNDGWVSESELGQRMKIARKAYLRSISSGLGERGVGIAYPIRLRVGKTPHFSLLYASKRPDAVELWSEELARYELRLIGAEDTTDSGQISLLPNFLLQERRSQIDSLISDRLSIIGTETGKQLISYLRTTHEFVVKGSEVEEALERLREAAKVDRSSSRGYRNVSFTWNQR